MNTLLTEANNTFQKNKDTHDNKFLKRSNEMKNEATMFLSRCYSI